MNAVLVAKDLAAAHGDRVLFSGLGVVVGPGDVVGLVGANGAGKSTLLRALAGLDPVQAGTVTIDPADASVGYLPQEPDPRPHETMRQFLARRTGVAAAHAAMQAAADALAAGTPGADEDYSRWLERWLGLGGADLDERAGAVAAGLGLAVDLDQEMTALSGGQAARAGLASLLLSRYDVFLLDEPTNNLDLDGLAQLEEFVQGLGAGVVVVSHDREFLSRTVTRVVELDLSQQQVRTFGGGYAAYLAEREVARRHEREAYDEYAARRTGLEERARSQRAWMEKGVRNARRKQPDNDKIGRKFRAEASEKQAAKALNELLQLGQAVQVEVVRGLVEQEHVVAAEQQRGQPGPGRLATGQRGHLLIKVYGQAQPGGHGAGPLVQVGTAQPEPPLQPA